MSEKKRTSTKVKVLDSFDILPVGIKLSLAELRSTTSSLETVLLSLLHSWITSEESSLLEGWTELGIEFKKSS